MGLSKDLSTPLEVANELDEVVEIYKAILERTPNKRMAYLELLEAHNMAPLSKLGLWPPGEFLNEHLLLFWHSSERDSLQPWAQIAAIGSILWLWLLVNETKLNPIDQAFLQDQKMRLFFLIPGLLSDQKISPYVKVPNSSFKMTFDESKFAQRCLAQSILGEIAGQKPRHLDS